MTSRVVPVGLLTTYVKTLLEGDDLLADVWVEGEVSNLFRAQSGHVYFTVRDGDGQLKCVLFRAQVARQRSLPAPGDAVAVHGYVTIYERDGALQLYADVVQPAGIGLLALQLEQLRLRLEAEGLFDVSRKRALPVAPRVIGVVTSPDGAVWHDIQNVVRRRYPFAELLLAPTPVQGAQAPAGIVAALEAIQEDGRAEVVIVARGGGAVEELWAFNDERVVRAVFASKVPVVSGVGHETDWTLIDDVADLRAPTPSAAAELCVPALAEIGERLDEFRDRLVRSTSQALAQERDDLAHLQARLWRSGVRGRVLERRQRTLETARRAARTEAAMLAAARNRVALQTALLRTLAPGAVLGRGYAVLSDDETGTPVCTIGETRVGRRIRADLADGAIIGQVQRLEPATTMTSEARA